MGINSKKLKDVIFEDGILRPGAHQDSESIGVYMSPMLEDNLSKENKGFKILQTRLVIEFDDLQDMLILESYPYVNSNGRNVAISEIRESDKIDNLYYAKGILSDPLTVLDYENWLNKLEHIRGVTGAGGSQDISAYIPRKVSDGQNSPM